ncbi:MAG: glycosyltransferase family 4 protein [Bacteroidota bacterium]
MLKKNPELVMIKVIHVIWSATIGGIERVVMDLISQQQKNADLTVSLLIAKSEGDLLPHFASLNIEVFALGLKGGHDISAGCYRKAKELFQHNDIIHIHSFNPLIALAAKNSNRKIIYTEHGNFGIGKKTGWRDDLVSSLQKRFLNSSVDFIIFNSKFSEQFASGRYGLSRVKKQVIYNGIPAFIPSGSNPEIPELKNSFVVGTIARMAGVKRIDRLLKTYALFSKDKMDCRLYVIGDGPLLQEMKNLAVKLGIERTTIFAGYRQDARYCLQSFDVCAFTSEKEAFGLVAIEAYDAGKPVIVFSDSGGLAEIVSPQDDGDVVNDEKEFAERINTYYNNRSGDFNGIDQEQRKNYAKQFTIERMEKEIYTVYKNTCTT